MLGTRSWIASTEPHTSWFLDRPEQWALHTPVTFANAVARGLDRHFRPAGGNGQFIAYCRIGIEPAIWLSNLGGRYRSQDILTPTDIGIDYASITIPDHAGRPTPIVNDGQAISELTATT